MNIPDSVLLGIIFIKSDIAHEQTNGHKNAYEYVHILQLLHDPKKVDRQRS